MEFVQLFDSIVVERQILLSNLFAVRIASGQGVCHLDRPSRVDSSRWHIFLNSKTVAWNVSCLVCRTAWDKACPMSTRRLDCQRRIPKQGFNFPLPHLGRCNWFKFLHGQPTLVSEEAWPNQGMGQCWAGRLWRIFELRGDWNTVLRLGPRVHTCRMLWTWCRLCCTKTSTIDQTVRRWLDSFESTLVLEYRLAG